MAWGVYSPSGTLSNYFAGAGANVTVGETLDWHFAITNQMGSIQYVKVVFRLANSTTATPNATIPGTTVPEIGESSIFIPNDQTASVNFTWTISSKSLHSGMVFVHLIINGQQVFPQIGAVRGKSFRFFFELWTYDLASNLFEYGYKGQGPKVGLPLQVWFISV
jgi:hypothetical protein